MAMMGVEGFIFNYPGYTSAYVLLAWTQLSTHSCYVVFYHLNLFILNECDDDVNCQQSTS